MKRHSALQRLSREHHGALALGSGMHARSKFRQR